MLLNSDICAWAAHAIIPLAASINRDQGQKRFTIRIPVLAISKKADFHPDAATPLRLCLQLFYNHLTPVSLATRSLLRHTSVHLNLEELSGHLRKTAFSGGRLAPSLNALHTFEAAARLRSLTRAAEELHVTVSAVAFQVKQVEQVLGVKLIARAGRTVDVTREGAALAAELSAPFDAIRRTAQRYRSLPAPADVVTVSMLPSFASMWLLPRLFDLQAAYPRLDLRISTSERRVRLMSEGIDCAIRCGPGGWAELEATYLFPQRLAPLCHASYTARAAPLATPADLVAHSLIGNRARPSEWEDWSSTASASTPQPVQLVENRELVLSSIRAGLGIGLLDVSVLQKEIEGGDLIQPFDKELDTGWSHFFVNPAGRPLSSACEVFRDWIIAQARSSLGDQAP